MADAERQTAFPEDVVRREYLRKKCFLFYYNAAFNPYISLSLSISLRTVSSPVLAKHNLVDFNRDILLPKMQNLHNLVIGVSNTN